MAVDEIYNNQKHKQLAGSGSRIAEFDSSGNLIATKVYNTAKLSDATTIALLVNSANWDSNGDYTGTAITGTFEGQYYYANGYYYFAYSDNSWKRLQSNRVNGTLNYLAKFTAPGNIGNSLIFDDGTNVGIGTPTPAEKLEVVDADNTTVKIKSSNQNAALYLGFTEGNAGAIWAYNSANALPAPLMLQDVGGAVIIGTGTPTGAKLDVFGTVKTDNTITANDFILNSDLRLKSNVKELTKGIDRLKPKSFTYKNDKFDGIHYGFIAQDMLISHPELVMMDQNEFLSIKQNSIIALLVKEVQELKKELQEIKANLK